MKYLHFAISLPKCSLYRRFRLFILRKEITASLLCAVVFWFILAHCTAAMLFLVGSVILKSIFG